jgi:hypothetical protein
MAVLYANRSSQAPAYASEVCPIPLRPYLTTYVNSKFCDRKHLISLHGLYDPV